MFGGFFLLIFHLWDIGSYGLPVLLKGVNLCLSIPFCIIDVENFFKTQQHKSLSFSHSLKTVLWRMSLISLLVKKLAVTLKPLISSAPSWVKKHIYIFFFFVVHNLVEGNEPLMEV